MFCLFLIELYIAAVFTVVGSDSISLQLSQILNVSGTPENVPENLLRPLAHLAATFGAGFSYRHGRSSVLSPR